jgi:hypothetical protein
MELFQNTSKTEILNGAKSGGIEGAKVTEGTVEAAEPDIEFPGAAAAAARSLKASDLTADQLVDMLASKLGGAGLVGVHDSIPWSPGTGLPVLGRILQAGAQVLTNLLKKLEITQLVPGYNLLNLGAAAELDYDCVVAKRLDDVHQHVERAIAAEADLDLPRASGILKEA